MSADSVEKTTSTPEEIHPAAKIRSASESKPTGTPPAKEKRLSDPSPISPEKPGAPFPVTQLRNEISQLSSITEDNARSTEDAESPLAVRITDSIGTTPLDNTKAVPPCDTHSLDGEPTTRSMPCATPKSHEEADETTKEPDFLAIRWFKQLDPRDTNPLYLTAPNLAGERILICLCLPNNLTTYKKDKVYQVVNGIIRPLIEIFGLKPEIFLGSLTTERTIQELRLKTAQDTASEEMFRGAIAALIAKLSQTQQDSTVTKEPLEIPIHSWFSAASEKSFGDWYKRVQIASTTALAKKALMSDALEYLSRQSTVSGRKKFMAWFAQRFDEAEFGYIDEKGNPVTGCLFETNPTENEFANIKKSEKEGSYDRGERVAAPIIEINIHNETAINKIADEYLALFPAVRVEQTIISDYILEFLFTIIHLQRESAAVAKKFSEISYTLTFDEYLAARPWPNILKVICQENRGVFSAVALTPVRDKMTLEKQDRETLRKAAKTAQERITQEDTRKKGGHLIVNEAFGAPAPTTACPPADTPSSTPLPVQTIIVSSPSTSTEPPTLTAPAPRLSAITAVTRAASGSTPALGHSSVHEKPLDTSSRPSLPAPVVAYARRMARVTAEALTDFVETQECDIEALGEITEIFAGAVKSLQDVRTRVAGLPRFLGHQPVSFDFEALTQEPNRVFRTAMSST